jgi:hypothetical protein
MCTNLFLETYDFNNTFVVESDASRNGIGVVITQDGRPLAFTRQVLSGLILGRSTYEKKDRNSPCSAHLAAISLGMSFSDQNRSP